MLSNQQTSLWPECIPWVTIWPIPSWVILIGLNIHVLFIDHLTTIGPNLGYTFIFHNFNPLNDFRVVVVVVASMARSFNRVFLIDNPLVEGHLAIWIASVVTRLPSNFWNVGVVVIGSHHCFSCLFCGLLLNFCYNYGIEFGKWVYLYQPMYMSTYILYTWYYSKK